METRRLPFERLPHSHPHVPHPSMSCQRMVPCQLAVGRIRPWTDPWAGRRMSDGWIVERGRNKRGILAGTVVLRVVCGGRHG